MTDLYRFVVETVFGGFLESEPALMVEIEGYGGELRVEGGALIFTLPALFAFACDSYARRTGNDTGTDRAHYLRFRKALYANPTHAHVRREGGHMEIASPSDDPDLRRYRLICQAPPGPPG